MLIFIISTILISGLIFWLWRASKTMLLERPVVMTALVLKIVAGVGVGLLYSRYYSGGDTWQYHTEASKLMSVFWQHPRAFLSFIFQNTLIDGVSIGYMAQPRALYMVKLLSCSYVITGGNYWLSSVLFSMFSFWGALILTQQIAKIFPSLKTVAVVALLFYPSVVFWSSGILKESIAFGALCICMASCLALVYGKKEMALQFLLFVLSFILLWKLKYYVAAVLALVLVPTMVMQLISKNTRNKLALIAGWSTLFLLLALVITQIHPNFYLHRFVDVIVQNHNQYMNHSSDVNIINFCNLKPTVWSLAMNSPWAIFSAWFRPMFFETTNTLQFLLSLENALLLLWVAGGVISLKAKKHDEHLYVAMSVICYVVLLSAFLALSTPNFGTLSRYRVAFVPFLVILFWQSNWWIGLLKRVGQNLKK